VALTYPDSIWYTFNNVYYWPYRGWETVSDPNYTLERGEYRYFRYNVAKKWGSEPVRKAAAACIRLNGLNCYEVNDGESYFCEGFLEPQCEGVTLGHLIQYLTPMGIEVATTTVFGLEETLNDLDDFLSLDYHAIHPVTLAGPDDHLLPDNYYPVSAFYKGRKPTTLYRAPTAAEAQALLLAKGMDFYQPYRVQDPIAIPFVLYTANQDVTPRQLADILLADYVAVNLNPLDKDEQRALQAYDRGASLPAAVVRLFTAAGKGTADVVDIPAALLENLKYVAYAGIAAATVYAGVQVYKAVKEG